MEKDYNHLKEWLVPKLEDRHMSVEDLARTAMVSRRSIYSWLDDSSRPTTQSMAKIVHILSAAPVLRQIEGHVMSVREEVTLEDAMKQFTERPLGRPKGSGSGVRAVSTRSRR